MSGLSQAKALLAAGRASEALAALAPLGDADLGVLTSRGHALKALGRMDEALVSYTAGAARYPQSGVAEYNVGALLGDMHRHEEAVAHAEAARGKGLDLPEVWLVLARARQGLGDYGDAERAFRQALARRPGWREALRDLSQLIWMRTADVAAAAEPLDAAARAQPGDPGPAVVKAKLLQTVAGGQAAYALLSDALRTAAPAARLELELAASGAAMASGRAEAALVHAQAAAALSPGGEPAALLLCDALLGLGRAKEAESIAGALAVRRPDDGGPLSRLYVAWRLQGDPRAARLYDYDTLVRSYVIDTPPGWTSLESYLDDLAEALEASHAFSAHPFDQSLRGGSQTSADLRAHRHPAVRAFFTAINGPIRRHMAALGGGDDPVRGRNTGGYRLSGAWSVRLKPEGFHTNHVHPQGWLSSACYIRLPSAVSGEGRQGWIGFGQPGVTTRPPLEPEYYVKPEPGMLVLFPSYMWHGTVPFGGDEPRLTAAFDVVPG